MNEKWIEDAKKIGFDVVAPCKVETLRPRKDIRDMCASDRCHAYGNNWTCPPHCGTLEECSQKIQQYKNGILVQTIGIQSKVIDSKCYRKTEQRHMEMFRKLVLQLRKEYPDALGLGSGGCRVCKHCAYPEPCRFPEQAYSSMEGYGLFVTQVCKENQVSYYHGEKTITYTACILF